MAITPLVIQADDDIKMLSPVSKNILVIKISYGGLPTGLYFTQAVRGCYFSSEGKLAKLKYYKTYTQARCHTECVADHVYERCLCKHIASPGELRISVIK